MLLRVLRECTAVGPQDVYWWEGFGAYRDRIGLVYPGAVTPTF